jgi:argininosuccinate lyase
MAAYLGFDGLAYNTYDAGQVYTYDNAAESSAVVTSLALHVGGFVEDVMQQYAQPRPWILLQEGGENTYVSSAMPQKRNPGILNRTRTDASTVLGSAVGCCL